VRRHDDNARRQAELPKPGRPAKTVETRHDDVQQNQIGAKALCKVDRFIAIAGGCPNVKA